MESGERVKDYVIRGKLASGGMAEIYRAVREGALGASREVCIKRVRRELGDAAFVEMFVDEARISMQLRHANIVSVEDFDEADGALYLVMEWVHGVDAAELLRRAAPAGRGLPVDVVVHLLACLLRALAYAHAKRDASGRWLGIVHRDVSPHNLLVSFEGDVKLSDFGIAKAATRMHRTDGVQLKGKLAYMAPEQALGGEVDARADLWAAGVVAYQLLSGRLPHAGGNAGELLSAVVAGRRDPIDVARPGLPPALAALVERLLATSPADRCQSAAEALDALEALPERATGARSLRALLRAVAPGEGFSTVEARPAVDAAALEAAPTVVTPLDRALAAAAASREAPNVLPTAPGSRRGTVEIARAPADAGVTAAARPRPAPVSTAEPSPAPVPAVTAVARPTPRAAEVTETRAHAAANTEPLPETRVQAGEAIRAAARAAAESSAADATAHAPPASGGAETAEDTLGPIAVVRAPTAAGVPPTRARRGRAMAAGLATLGLLAVAGGRAAVHRAARAAPGGRAATAAVAAGPNGLDAWARAQADAARLDAGTAVPAAAADAAATATRAAHHGGGAALATLEVEAIPWCNLVIDDTRTVYDGHTLRLPPGRHTIACTQDNRRFTTETVTLRAGERRRLRITAPGESL